MSNYKVLFVLRVLKSIFTTFVDTFLVMYFLEVSESNILPLGIYKLVAMTTVFVVIFLLRNICKSKYRVNLMRIGIIFNFIYFLSIILLKDKVIDYIYLIGLLFGLEEGFYFSVYNTIESDGIINEERAKFTGNYTAVKAILAIVFPLLFGGLIHTTGFIKSLIIVLVIVTLQIVLSFLYKDQNIPKGDKTDLKKFYKITKENKLIKKVYINRFFSGLTYSEGALSSIVAIYIINVFSTSVSLGVFTSIFSLISCVIGLLFAKCIKQKHYNPLVKIFMLATVVSLCSMIINCNFVTIVIYNFCQTFSKGLMDLINCNSASNASNLECLREEFKVEYWLGCEASLFVGRVISNSLFILMAFTSSDIMIYIFVGFLIMLGCSSVKLQEVIEEG